MDLLLVLVTFRSSIITSNSINILNSFFVQTDLYATLAVVFLGHDELSGTD